MVRKAPAAASSLGARSGMPLAFMRRGLVVIPLLAVVAGALIALRIIERGEFWLDRTYWLIATAAFGGFAGAVATRIVLRSRRLSRWRLPVHFPRLVAGGVFACLFMLGMMAGFVAQNLLIGGQFELNPDRPVRSAIFTSLQIAALFLISCPTYLLPWPLPLLSATAGWLLAPATPTDSAKAVEPTGDGV